MKIKFEKDYTVQDGSGTVYKKDKTYDLEERSARHFLNRKLAVEAEKGESEEDGEEGELTAADIRKMKRAELDDLAAERGVDLADFNVDDSRELLIQEMKLEDNEG